jgi:hypothetical protein
MIESIINAGLKPFTETLGWQAFAYGVVGRIVVTYAKNFVNQLSATAETASEKTEEDLSKSENG